MKDEAKLNELEEKVNFLTDLLRVYQFVQMDSLFEDWKKGHGVFAGKKKI